MAIKISLILSREDHPNVEEEIFCFDQGISEDALIGLSLDEAKQILKLGVKHSPFSGELLYSPCCRGRAS